MNNGIELLRVRTRMACLSCAGWLMTTIILLAQDQLDQASLISVMPNDVHAFMTTSSFRQLISRWDQSAIGNQLKHPAWQPLLKSHQQIKEGSWFNPEPWFGVPWSDLQAIDQPTAIAIAPNAEGSYVYLLLFQLGERASSHPLVQKWMERQGGASQLKQSQVGTCTFFSTKEAAKSSRSAMALGKQWTCFASSDAWLQTWLMKKRNAETQIHLELLSVDVSESPNPPLCIFWGQPWKLVMGFTEKADPKLFKSLKVFGLDGLQTVQGRLTAPADSEKPWSIRYGLDVSEPFEKGLGILSYSLGPKSPVPRVFPNDLDQVGQCYIDIKSWFLGVSHAIDQMIDEETPGNFADLLDSILSDPEGPKVDIRKDLIYRLGPMLGSGSKTIPDVVNEESNVGANGASKSQEIGQYRRQRIWSCQLQDAKLAESALEKLFSNDDEVTSERIGEFRCWSTADNQSLFIATNNPEGQSICVAAVDNTSLYLANDSRWLKDLLQHASTQANWSNTSFSNFATHSDEQVSARHSIDLRRWLKRSWSRLPESSERGASSSDFIALLLTKVLFPNPKSSSVTVPLYEVVEPILGVLNHSMKRSNGRFDGVITLENR